MKPAHFHKAVFFMLTRPGCGVGGECKPHLSELFAVRVAWGKVGVARVVPHEILGQEIDGVKVILFFLSSLQSSVRHLYTSQ